MLDIRQNYYVKNIIYGNYIKEIMLPYDVIKRNPRNKTGVKNIGINETKLLHNNVRSKSNFVRKVYHNFSTASNLSFLTLTYAFNEVNVKKCKKDLAKFFKQLKRIYLDLKGKDLKYVYTYEYQGRGAVHFHILMDYKFKNQQILSNWKHGINRNLKVKENTQEFVAQYCSKYITANYMSKTSLQASSKNQYDLNLKSYQFSYSCLNPTINKSIVNLTLNQIVKKAEKSEFARFMKAKYKKDVETKDNPISKIKTIMIGASYDYKISNYEKDNNSFKLLN